MQNKNSHWKRPWCWERLRSGGEGDHRGWDGWMASPTQWTWVWAILGNSEGQGSLPCCSLWGHKELDMTEWLNNNKFYANLFRIWRRNTPLPIYSMRPVLLCCSLVLVVISKIKKGYYKKRNYRQHT